MKAIVVANISKLPIAKLAFIRFIFLARYINTLRTQASHPRGVGPHRALGIQKLQRLGYLKALFILKINVGGYSRP